MIKITWKFELRVNITPTEVLSAGESFIKENRREKRGYPTHDYSTNYHLKGFSTKLN